MVLSPQCLSVCSEFACLAWFRRHARSSRMAFQSGCAVGPGGDLFLAHRARHSAQRLAGGRYGGGPPPEGGAPPPQFSFSPGPPRGFFHHSPLSLFSPLAVFRRPPSFFFFFSPSFGPPSSFF